jgi:hypothetical protein
VDALELQALSSKIDQQANLHMNMGSSFYRFSLSIDIGHLDHPKEAHLSLRVRPARGLTSLLAQHFFPRPLA